MAPDPMDRGAALFVGAELLRDVDGGGERGVVRR